MGSSTDRFGTLKGECIACFRPPLVRNVRAGGHYEFRWEGRPDPVIRKL